MPMPTASFVLGLILLGYLLTFVLFAILRIVTGVSIQRVGYSGFRHIAFSPRHGITINIRGVGISLHRPTFALPTWCSLVITELVVKVDLKALAAWKEEKSSQNANGKPVKSKDAKVDDQGRGASERLREQNQSEEGHGKLWRKLTDVKEKIKQMHSNINYIKLLDLVAAGATVDIVGVGSLHLERLTVQVDTRSKTVDRSRLFQHYKPGPETQSPAEWKCAVRSILFHPEGRDSTEILDYAAVNIHGMLHHELQGLREASISVKLGRLTVPYDDIEHAKKCAALLQGTYAQPHDEGHSAEKVLSNVVEELEVPQSPEDRIVQNVSDSRAFIASILRGILEVQFAVSSFGLSRKLDVKGEMDRDVYFNLAMKEVGLDILRLDPKSPAHKMYFSTKDVAHQGMVTAISISAGIDDGHKHPERMVYVPMITATARTTLPSRTVHRLPNHNASERNTNMLYANLVCTSPSVDLDPKHLPLLRDILNRRGGSSPPKMHVSPRRHHLISQLLPKSHIKLSVQEPVIRVSLPPMDKEHAAEDDFDLLISSLSTASIEVESSHLAEGAIHYNLVTDYRHTKHHLYYQTWAGERHDLLQSDTVEVHVDINAIPDASVVISGRLQTFAIYLTRPDICEGVRQIMEQLRKNVLARHNHDQRPMPSFLRTMPAWLKQCRIEGSDFSLELAGVDEQVSKDTRGCALRLESWTTEYRAQREDEPDAGTRRRSLSRAVSLKDKEKEMDSKSRSGSPKRRPQTFADGRRLTFHLQNMEGYIVAPTEESKAESCLSVPRFEVAFSTSTDAHGPIYHINSHARSVLLQYSLYYYFAVGAAAMVLRKTFLDRDHEPSKSSSLPTKGGGYMQVPNELKSLEDIARHEVRTIDFKASLVQVKARMPADPPMMIQLYDIGTGIHRYGTPFLRCNLSRLYVRAPRTKAAWSRVVTLKALRLDLRELKRKVGKQYVAEKSIDVVMETARIGIPHGVVVHSIFDNITNVIKTTKQLHHHFATGTNEYVLAKEPEGPKYVPRINVRSQLVLFEIEDSSFEWKLNAIYRAGLLEQKQRMAREDAFSMKERRLARHATRGSSRFRAASANPEKRSRSKASAHTPGNQRRSRSNTGGSRWSPQNSQRDRDRGRRIRYDAEGKCGISDVSQLSIDAAREKLHLLNSQSWKTRIDRVESTQSRIVREIRSLFSALDDLPEGTDQQEHILALSMRPALLVASISDFQITVDKPSFPMKELPNFMHDVGKGMPYDMKYGLLIPMNLNVSMGDARVQLRDYPLPLLHVPPLASGQSPRLASLSVKTDFVIAEEFRGFESQRSVNVEVVPKDKMSTGNAFAVDVRRTISPVKTYSDMKIEINTSNATKITWGTSYQPAIQETMQVVEGFTKPPVDTSDRVGFWDKIRLSFHSRVHVAWKGDGDVHLVLKGSRDPYVVTGQGAGLVMVWRNNVSWNIAQNKDLRRFMTVDSGEYILAVPDFSGHARRSQEDSENEDSGSTSSSSITKKEATFSKVVMKLSGNVRWLCGLVFQGDLKAGSRSFEFEPHWDVHLKHPDYATAPPGEEYDAFRDFRSHHIHMSVAIAAPYDRDWSVLNKQPSSNYNSIHLSPRFFSHFFSWWSMFSGVMSLPIRQGPLWGAMQKKSKKFGRHLATFKYNLLLSPLYVSHVYKHKDPEDYNESVVSATGLKMRLDSFMLDLHQRREYFDIKGHEGAQSKKSSGLRINEAQLDFISADLRALSASIAGTSTADIEKANDETLAGLAGLYSQSPAIDMSKFDIPDNDFNWIDMDDFVELDWILPAEADPQTKILPLGYAPRFTYFRQTDHGGSIAGDPTRTSPFGEEQTHHCVMSIKNDPRRVQTEMIEKRLNKLKEQRSQNERTVGEQELRVLQGIKSDRPASDKAQALLDNLRAHGEQLQRKFEFLQIMLDTLSQRVEQEDPSTVPDLETSEAFFKAQEKAKGATEKYHEPDDAPPLADYSSDFNNRFIVHNAQIKWNNSLRNIILRYIHQNSQRRGFVYYMSQRAVKFILDVIEERNKADKSKTSTRQKSVVTDDDAVSPDGLDDDATVQDRIEELLRDGRAYVNADDSTAKNKTEDSPTNDGPKDEIAVEYTPLNTFQFRLIAPQVQLQSEKNPKAAVLVTAKGMQLKVVEIMDKDRVSDDVSGLVQRRFTAAADSLQMFVTTTKSFTTEHLHMYSANRYGAKAGTYWPPWVPMEIMFEFESSPFGFNRVVHRTSASLRYDKYNSLRLKYNDDVSGGDRSARAVADDGEAEIRMDHVWVEFPQFRAIADSSQYYALYIIVMDLLLYTEPLEKTRTERLEKIMLASDFSDLSGAPEMVYMLQQRIRQLEEIKTHFQINEKYLDRQGWKDRIAMDQDLANCEDELFFMMKAITTAQQRIEDRRDQESVAGLLHINMSAKEIAWHLIRDKDESLMEFQLKHASFDRTENNDGSNYNVMAIQRINGFNLLPDAVYPEIIAPFIDENRGYYESKHGSMLRVHWLMLEAIAGIPVVDYFEVDLVPLKLQVERDIAKKLFEYIFPGVGGNAFEGGGFSPFMVKNMLPAQDEEDESTAKGTDTAIPSIPEAESESLYAGETGAVPLEQRLKPTLHLPKRQKPVKADNKGLGISHPNSSQHHGFSIFQHSDRSRQTLPPRAAASRQALGSSNGMSRTTSERSLATMNSSAPSGDTEKSKRFGLHRTQSHEQSQKKDNERSDDLTQMMNRASNYMTLSFVKIPSMVLCLSYKGQGKRNIEDVHDLVFRMPTLEYRNKTWSNLDLALQLKKDIIRALISHAGAIVGNKFSHHKPSKVQSSRLREIANMSAFMSPTHTPRAASDTTSLQDFNRMSIEPPHRPSTASARPSTYNESPSMGSTASVSSANEAREPAEESADGQSNGGQANGEPDGAATIRRASSIPPPSRQGTDDGQSRPRATSISRHFSGFSERRKQKTDSSNGDEAEESKRKSRLLLGPQKFLRNLRDQ